MSPIHLSAAAVHIAHLMLQVVGDLPSPVLVLLAPELPGVSWSGAVGHHSDLPGYG